jgi:hypothetical protein
MGSAILAPHSPQNLALGGLGVPQEGHNDGMGTPHSTQKRLPSDCSVLQLRHSIVAPGSTGIGSVSRNSGLDSGGLNIY